MATQEITKQQCYEASDKLKDLILRYEQLILQEPGSHHPGCYCPVNVEGVRYSLCRKGRHIALEEVERAQTFHILTDSKITLRLEGAKALPLLLNLAKQYNTDYYNLTNNIAENLEALLPEE